LDILSTQHPLGASEKVNLSKLYKIPQWFEEGIEVFLTGEKRVTQDDVDILGLELSIRILLTKENLGTLLDAMEVEDYWSTVSLEHVLCYRPRCMKPALKLENWGYCSRHENGVTLSRRSSSPLCNRLPSGQQVIPMSDIVIWCPCTSPEMGVKISDLSHFSNGVKCASCLWDLRRCPTLLMDIRSENVKRIIRQRFAADLEGLNEV